MGLFDDALNVATGGAAGLVKDLVDGDDAPAAAPLHFDAVALWSEEKAYFFSGDQYYRYDVEADTVDQGYPRKIAGNWPGIWGDGLDAVIVRDTGKAYFFKGDQYIRYDLVADTSDDRFPAAISANWHGF